MSKQIWSENGQMVINTNCSIPTDEIIAWLLYWQYVVFRCQNFSVELRRWRSFGFILSIYFWSFFSYNSLFLYYKDWTDIKNIKIMANSKKGFWWKGFFFYEFKIFISIIKMIYLRMHFSTSFFSRKKKQYLDLAIKFWNVFHITRPNCAFCAL